MDDGFLQALEKLQLPSTGVEGSYAPAAATPATAVDTRHHHHRNKQQQAATDAVAEQRYDNEQPAAVRRSPPSNSCEILVGSKLLRGRSFIQGDSPTPRILLLDCWIAGLLDCWMLDCWWHGIVLVIMMCTTTLLLMCCFSLLRQSRQARRLVTHKPRFCHRRK
jgi:hypothetical protein